METNKLSNKTILFKNILFGFNIVNLCYDHYINNGKSYLYARQLRKYNHSLKNNLLKAIDYSPLELQSDFSQIILHLETWETIWDEHDSKSEHFHNNEFVFQTIIPFPKESTEAIKYHITSNL